MFATSTEPPGLPQQRPADVTLVPLRLDLAEARLRELEPLLSPAERDRAARLVPRAAQRFIAGRGQLRQLLGRLVGAAPEALEFEAGPAGKPVLGGRHAGGWQFNVSHSQDRGLVACSAALPVGIDLECVAATHTTAWADDLAGSILGAGEHVAYRLLPGPDRPRALVEAWVAKEALLKATGAGVAAGVRHVLLPAPLPRATIIAAAPPTRAPLAAVAGLGPGSWAVCLLDLGPDVRAALACPRAECRIALEEGWDGRPPPGG